jgi:hypothetical protein
MTPVSWEDGRRGRAYIECQRAGSGPAWKQSGGLYHKRAKPCFPSGEDITCTFPMRVQDRTEHRALKGLQDAITVTYVHPLAPPR